MLKRNKYLILALIFALLNMGAIFWFFGFQEYGDTSGYIKAIHWMQGEKVEIDPWWLLRPLGPILALPFEFLGEGAGLIVQNIIFYFLSALLVFGITEIIFENKKQALLASIFFVSSSQVLEVGLSYLTDTGAWFFYLLSIFLTLLYLKNRSEKLIFLNGLLSGLGFLMKENGALGALFFGLMIIFSRDFTFKDKIYKILSFGIFFVVPIISWEIFMYQRFQFTALDWYLYHLEDFSQKDSFVLMMMRYFGQLLRTLGALWALFFIGLWQELKEKNYQRLKIYLAMLPASFSFFLWPTSAGGRSVFIFASLGILLASYGSKRVRSFILAGVIIAVLISNYWFVSVNKEIAFIDTIYTLLFSR